MQPLHIKIFIFEAVVCGGEAAGRTSAAVGVTLARSQPPWWRAALHAGAPLGLCESGTFSWPSVDLFCPLRVQPGHCHHHEEKEMTLVFPRASATAGFGPFQTCGFSLFSSVHYSIKL